MMQNEIFQFDFKGITLRAVKIAGEPWFVAKDITDALGITRKSQGNAVAALREGAERTLYQIQKGVRSQVLVNEAGLKPPPPHGVRR